MFRRNYTTKNDIFDTTILVSLYVITIGAKRFNSSFVTDTSENEIPNTIDIIGNGPHVRGPEFTIFLDLLDKEICNSSKILEELLNTYNSIDSDNDEFVNLEEFQSDTEKLLKEVKSLP